MFSTRKSVVLLAVIALLLSALACSLPGGEEEPTEAPPTAVADVAPTDEPAPTEAPTEEPTAEPTAVPTEEPAPEPTDEPTPEPEPTAATGGAVSSGLEPGWRLYTNGNYVNELAYADGPLGCNRRRRGRLGSGRWRLCQADHR